MAIVRTDTGVDGLLLVDKPEGPTSHDVVERVRALTGQQRVGHAGTLDPMASGLLPMVLGRATRLVRFLPREPKLYEGELRLGLTTDSDDVTGEVTRRHDGPLPKGARVLETASALEGRTLQVPPAFSARKVGGRRLYRLARAGRPVSAPPAPVEVRRFALKPAGDAASWAFAVEVSSGTYVRALVRDLGAALGTGAVLSRLRRTAIGPLRVDDAIGLEDASREALAGAVIPLGAMPLSPPALTLSDEASARRFRSGGAVPIPARAPDEGLHRVLDRAGELLGIGEITGGRLCPRVVIDPA